jgi:hypothetical protein
VALGPKGVFELTEGDCETVEKIEERVDKELRSQPDDWGGESPVFVDFLSSADPNLAVRTEVRRLYLEAGWSSCEFEFFVGLWRVVLEP